MKLQAVLGLIFFALFTVSGTQAFGRPFGGGPFGTADDVVVVFCERQDGPPGGIFVAFSSSSLGAPSVPVGTDTNCAEELAKLTNAGFRFQSVVPGGDLRVIYTLVRK